MLRRSAHFLNAKRTSAQSLDFCKSKYNAGIGRICEVMMEKGEGCYLYDTDGKKYLDFIAGIGVCNLGHCHPKLVADCQKQLATLWHGQINTGFHQPLEELIERMMRLLAPHHAKSAETTLDNFLFVSTGSEAVEAAIKLSRCATKRPCLATMQGGYHGRTLGAASLTTSKASYGHHIKPFVPGVVVLPVPYHRQCKVPFTMSYDELSEMCLSQIEDVCSQQCYADEVAMLIVEPVLGEGGYCPMPHAFWKGLRDFTKKHNIVLCADEIQSGFGRTGSLFMCDQYTDIASPDCITFAKGIANGMPLAGMVTTQALGHSQLPGSAGGTYAGNCIAVTSANGVCEIFEDKVEGAKLLDNVHARSKQLIGGLLAMVEKHNLPVTEVRGRGLMIGLEFDVEHTGIATAFKNECFKRNMLVPTTGKFEAVRLIPPLILTEAEAADALSIMEESLVAACSGITKKVSGFQEDGLLPGSSVPLRWTVV